MRGRERGEGREKSVPPLFEKEKERKKSWKRRPVDVQDRRHERTRYPLNESLIFFLRRPLVVHYKTVERYLPTHFHKTFQWTCIIFLLSRSILPFFFWLFQLLLSRIVRCRIGLSVPLQVQSSICLLLLFSLLMDGDGYGRWSTYLYRIGYLSTFACSATTIGRFLSDGHADFSLFWKYLACWNFHFGNFLQEK